MTITQWKYQYSILTLSTLLFIIMSQKLLTSITYRYNCIQRGMIHTWYLCRWLLKSILSKIYPSLTPEQLICHESLTVFKKSHKEGSLKGYQKGNDLKVCPDSSIGFSPNDLKISLFGEIGLSYMQLGHFLSNLSDVQSMSKLCKQHNHWNCA